MVEPKKVVILGASGTVGSIALKTVNRLQNVELVGATVWSNAKALQDISDEYSPKYLGGSSESIKKISTKSQLFSGICGIEDLVQQDDVDLVFCAISGFAALSFVLAAIDAKKDIAIASKEVLVAAGELVMRKAKENGCKIIPVDSEHSAIFQCLQSSGCDEIGKIILTGSGGPFLNLPADQFSSITIKQALTHPKWTMGPKISVDSATMMNKGLELIEAQWLFGLECEQMELLIQPEAIIHSMVEFRDNSVMALLGMPDMTQPVQYALTYPDRVASTVDKLDFSKVNQLNFLPPDRGKFPCLALAETVLKKKGTLQTVLNVANEIAVKRFLAGEIKFTDIYKVVYKTLEQHKNCPADSIETVLEVDYWARHFSNEINV